VSLELARAAITRPSAEELATTTESDGGRSAVTRYQERELGPAAKRTARETVGGATGRAMCEAVGAAAVAAGTRGASAREVVERSALEVWNRGCRRRGHR